MSLHVGEANPANPFGHTIAASDSAFSNSTLRISWLIFLFFMWEGIVPAALGFPRFMGQYFVSLTILACLALSLGSSLRKGSIPTFLLYPLAVFLCFVGITATSSTVFFGYGPNEWLTGQYVIVPVLVPFALHLWKVRAEEICRAIVTTGLLAAVLVSIINASGTEFLAEFARTSTFQQGYARVVMLKNEISFAAIYFAFLLIFDKSTFRRTVQRLVVVLFLLYVILFMQESRLAIAATGMAIAIGLFTFRGRSARRFLFSLVALMVSLLMLPQIYDRYIGAFSGEDYISAANVEIRLLELDYFWGYFEQTYGLGFGIYGLSADRINFAAWAADNMVPGYRGIGVHDLGIYGGLVQFGIAGIGVIIATTVWCLKQFYQAAKTQSAANRIGAMTAFSLLLGFMISPWPLDFFTLNWTVFLGWSLVYFAWCFKRDREARLFSN